MSISPDTWVRRSLLRARLVEGICCDERVPGERLSKREEISIAGEHVNRCCHAGSPTPLDLRASSDSTAFEGHPLRVGFGLALLSSSSSSCSNLTCSSSGGRLDFAIVSLGVIPRSAGPFPCNIRRRWPRRAPLHSSTFHAQGAPDLLFSS